MRSHAIVWAGRYWWCSAFFTVSDWEFWLSHGANETGILNPSNERRIDHSIFVGNSLHKSSLGSGILVQLESCAYDMPLQIGIVLEEMTKSKGWFWIIIKIKTVQNKAYHCCYTQREKNQEKTQILLTTDKEF